MLKPATVAAVVLSVPALAVAACSPNQNASTQPGTVPPIWTGSTSPGASSSAVPAGAQQLRARLSTANGTPVADATFDFDHGYATVTVETIGGGVLTPGFHGLTVHSIGKCEANSAAPAGGAPGDFTSAGPVFQAPGRSNHPASGQLTSLQVRADGAGRLVTTTDGFTAADLLGGQKTALIISANPDNGGNVPAESYQQANGTPGPDQAAGNTGDSGKGVACGVISAG
jgi:superoxide dismutase, Cu-Zn family